MAEPAAYTRAALAKILFLPAMIAITVAPFLAVSVPGLGDTMNHLARMHILLDIAHSTDLQKFYRVAWSPIPYLAMDTIIPLLARVMPFYAAAKVFVAACVLMPLAGVMSLQFALRRQVSPLSALALLLGANDLLALGFLNYLFMTGLAVMLFALWISSVQWPRAMRLCVFTLCATLLYFGHAFAFFGYGCAVAGTELARARRGCCRPAPAILADLAVAAFQAVPALFFALTLNTQPGAPGGLYTHYGDVGEKLLALASPLLFLTDPVQVTILLCCLAIAVCLARRLHIDKAIWPAALALGIAAAAMPEILASTWLTDFRLPLFTLVVLLGGASLCITPKWRVILSAAVASLILLKTCDVWQAMARMDGQVAEMRDLLSALPNGARLLVVNESAEAPADALSGSTLWHMPMLAVIERDAFESYLFTGLTTVHLRSEMAAFGTPQGGPVTLAQLDDDLAGRPPALASYEKREGLRIYWHNWQKHFDYMLVEHFWAGAPRNLPNGLSIVKATKDLDLFKVN
jgi:hypothetical protein